MDVLDAYWQQAQLSQRFSGLGLRSLSLHSCAAFISSLDASGQGSDLQHAISHFNAQVFPHNSISPSQKALSKRLDSNIFRFLLSSSSLVNKAQVLSFSAPQAGSWLSVVPALGLDLHLDSAKGQCGN